MRAFRRRSIRDREIAPDEIFPDSSNLPAYDQSQLEGRIERPIGKSTFALLGIVFVLVGVVYVGKLWHLQIARGDALATVSENNHLRHSPVFAERGIIYDRRGVELAWNEAGDADFSTRVYAPIAGIGHVVGYVSPPKKDGSGVYYQTAYEPRTGVERAFEETLAGKNGVRIVETDALGNVLAENRIAEPVDGRPVQLSIDARVQAALYERIEETARQQNFRGGSGVLLDVTTGEIIALASAPSFDPNIFAAGGDPAEVRETLQNPRNPFLNRAASGLYTPGSTVKPYVAAAALAEGVISPEKEIQSTGSISIPHPYVDDAFSVFRDWKAHGWVDMRDALAVSSNVYFYEIGGGFEDQKGLGIERIAEYMRRFGFAESTDLAISSEPTGTIPTPAWKAETFEDGTWRVGDTYNTAIGQYGFQVTPLQAARAIAAVANGGTLVAPQLKRGAAAEMRDIGISKDALAIVREGMRQAVTEGTAQAVSNTHATMAAKTGTAQVGARNESMNSWIIGFFPYENPRYAFAVVMEEAPAGTQIGAPFVMRQFIQWLAESAPEYLESHD